MWHANVQECAEQEPEARRRPGKGRIQDGNFHQLFTRHWSVRHCLPLGLRCVIWIRPEACVECTTVPHVGHVCECARLASRPLATRNCLPQPPPRRWSTHPVATVLCNDWAQYGQRYVYTRGVAVSGLRAGCWGDEWATPVLVSSVPVDVCLASCIFWISLRTSARIASCRWLLSRWRRRRFGSDSYSFLVGSESDVWVRQLYSFLVGSESDVRHWGPWPAGPVRPSGPCCLAVAQAPFWVRQL